MRDAGEEKNSFYSQQIYPEKHFMGTSTGISISMTSKFWSKEWPFCYWTIQTKKLRSCYIS